MKQVVVGLIAFAMHVPDAFSVIPKPILGTQKILYLVIQTADSYVATPVSSVAPVTDLVARFYNHAANGKAQFQFTIYPGVITLPLKKAEYGGHIQVGVAAGEIAKSNGYDPANFTRVVYDLHEYPVGYPNGGVYGGIGLGPIQDAGILAHELGHTYHLGHCRATNDLWIQLEKMFYPATSFNYTNGTNFIEYGDIYSFMGTFDKSNWGDSSKVPNEHTNPYLKLFWGWLSETNFQTLDVGSNLPSRTETVRIYAHDIGSVSSNLTVAARIPLLNPVYLSFIQGISVDSNSMNGIQIHVAPVSMNANTPKMFLLDTHSSLVVDDRSKRNPTLGIGETFSDPVSGTSITPIKKNGTIPESIDVQIAFSPVAPVLTYSDASGSYDQFGVRFGATPSPSPIPSPSPSPTGDTLAPVAQILTPGEGASVGNGFTLSVSGSDNVGITKSLIYIDGALFATKATGAYTIKISSRKWKAGSHTIRIESYDAAGNFGQASRNVLK